MRGPWTRVRDRPDAAAAVVLVAISAGLIAWLGSHARTFTIDSYFYLAKAQRLAQGFGLTVPWNDGIDRRFFWGYSIALAVPVRLFGERGFWVLASLVHVWLGGTFWRLLGYSSLRTGVRLGALALVLFNPIVLWWSTVPAAEPLFAALALASLERALAYGTNSSAPPRVLFLSAILGGLTLLTRAEGILLAPLLVYAVRGRLREAGTVGRLVIAAALFAVPETSHVLYLALHAQPGGATSAYAQDIQRHFRELEFGRAFWTYVRAPFWPVFRDDTEGWLYARYFPAWLTSLQTGTAYAYVVVLGGALFAGLRRDSELFRCAAALAAYAALHALWYYLYERFSFAIVPGAAFVFAGGIGRIGRLGGRVGNLAAPALLLIGAGICGVYGSRVAAMHDERLTLHEDGTDYRAIGAAISALDADRKPIVTDMGPYLAWYLNSWSYFESETEFYESGLPECQKRRAFLTDRQVRALVSKRPEVQLARAFDLDKAEYRMAPSSATVLLPSSILPGERPKMTLPVLELVNGADLGGSVRIEKVKVEPGELQSCSPSHVTVEFRAVAPLVGDYTVFVHVEDPSGHASRFNVDHKPTGQPRTSLWKPGDLIVDEFDVSVSPDYPSDRIQLLAGFWDGATDQRLPLVNPREVKNDGNNRVVLAEVPIVP